MFKKAIKTNGETEKVDIINMFGFISRIITLNEVKTLFKTIQIAFFHKIFFLR
jgi:hypothetical protein